MMFMNCQKLDVWKRAMTLVEEVYAITKSFPDDERFGLTSQIRRAVVSVPSNITEGSQRRSDKEFMGYLLIAKGSIAEVLTQLLIAERLQYVSPDDIHETVNLAQNIDKMLYRFCGTLSK